MSELNSIKIEEYSLVDFVMKIQQGIRDGYEVTDQLDDAPLQIGGGFYTIMREAAKPVKAIGKAVFEAAIDTIKLQEQLKSGGEIEQALADSLVVNEVKDFTDAHVAVYENAKQKEVPIPEPEPTMDEALPKDEQSVQSAPVKRTTRGRK